MEGILGSGNFRTARLAHKTGNNHKRYAIKSILRKKVEKDLNLLEAELDILLKVDHPNICNFYEAYLDHKYVHMVMEYCQVAKFSRNLSATVAWERKLRVPLSNRAFRRSNTFTIWALCIAT